MNGTILALSLAAVFVVAPNAGAFSVGWADEFGSGDRSAVWTLAVDDGFVYAHGGTYGALQGQEGFGIHDVFLRKYDAQGAPLWTREFGTPGGFTFAYGANNMALGKGAIYVSGYTDGTLPGQTSAGGLDAFLRKYDRDGNVRWTRQFGTSADESTGGVAVQDGSIYVTGSAGAALPGQDYAGGGADGFLRKYDTRGNVIWTREFGSDGFDQLAGIAVDDDAVYVGGFTDGALPGQTSAGGGDAFVRMYDSDGQVKWTRQFGTSGFDEVWGVVADHGAVYVHGDTEGALPGQTSAGGVDTFARKYTARGKEVWTRQLGSPGDDFGNMLAVADGTVYVTGATSAALPGQTSHGSFDAFVRTLDASGREGWTSQFGTEGDDFALAVAVGEDGVVFAGGWAGGPIFGQNFSRGILDAFAVQLLPGNDDVGDD